MKELIPLTFPCSPDQHPVEHWTWARSLRSDVFSKGFAFIFLSSVHNYVTNAAIVHKTITNGTNSQFRVFIENLQYFYRDSKKINLKKH